MESTRTIQCKGEWDVLHLSTIKSDYETLSLPSSGDIIIDGTAITKMDTAGAWFLNQWIKKITEKKLTPHLNHFSAEHQKLLSLIQKKEIQSDSLPDIKPISFLTPIGKWAVEQTRECRDFLDFTGKLATEAYRLTFHFSRWRLSALASTIYQTGYQALPIIALLSFMIGVVISYQMGNQLRNYGANIFIVNLLGLSVLREFGPLLTAIMVAGRTGSAFTAQLGTMRINQEIDAINTLGVTPAELLLLPRLIGLFIVMPLLTVWADIFGVLGGMTMAHTMLGLTWYDFLHRFQQEIPLRALIIGLGKAPVFALLIASVGCFQGMQVSGSADSVGKKTTRSVVLAIFFIIITDAIFSIIFSKMNL